MKNPLVFAIALSVIGLGCPSRDNPYDSQAPTTVQAKSSIEGTVFQTDGSPLTLATIDLAGPTEPGNNPAETDDTGGFRFTDLQPGTYTMTASRTGYLTQVRDVLLRPGEQRAVEITLVLLPEGAATGHITGVAQRSGQLARPAEEQDHSGIIVELGAAVRTITNKAGNFDLYITPGTYDLTLSAVGYQDATVTGISVEAEQTVTVPDSPVVLTGNPGAVSGLVLLETVEVNPAASFANITVSLEGSEQTTTADDGTYRIGDVAAGTYILRASLNRWQTVVRTNVVVAAGRDTVVENLVLPASRNTVTGTVTLVGQDDHSGVTASLTGTGFSTSSSPSGLFAIQGVPVGTFELTLSKSGYVRLVQTVSVEVTQATDIGNVQLIVRQGDFDINRGAAYTNQTQVTLDLDNEDAAAMRISEDPGFADTSWGPFASSTVFHLSDSDGAKTVYVQYRDSNNIESNRFSANITLDREPPQVELFHLQGGAAYTDSALVTLSMTVTDTSSGVQQMLISNSETFSGQPGPYQTSATFTLAEPTVDGEKTLWAHFWDFAGNRTSSPALASIILDTQAPVATDFRINNDDEYSTSALVALQIGGVSETSPLTMALANSNATGVYTHFSPTASWMLLPGDGTKTVSLYLRDAAGNTSVRLQDSITLDTQGPLAPSIVLDHGAAYTADATVAASLTATDASDYQISTSGTFGDTWTAYSDGLSLDVVLDQGEGSNTVYARFRDTAGNVTQAVTDSIILDTLHPDPPTVTMIASPEANGTEYVNKRDVLVQIDNTGDATKMRLAAVDCTDQASCGDVSDSCPDLSTRSSYYLSSTVVLNYGSDGLKKACLALEDEAGNLSSPGEDTIYVDTTAPTAPTLVPGNSSNVNRSCARIAPTEVVEDHFWKWQRRDNGGAWVDVDPTTIVDDKLYFDLLQDTDNLLWVRAVDQAGNVGAENSAYVEETSTIFVPTELTLDRVCGTGSSFVLLKDTRIEGTYPPIYVAQARAVLASVQASRETAILELNPPALTKFSGSNSLLELFSDTVDRSIIGDAICNTQRDAIIFSTLNEAGSMGNFFFAIYNMDYESPTGTGLLGTATQKYAPAYIDALNWTHATNDSFELLATFHTTLLPPGPRDVIRKVTRTSGPPTLSDPISTKIYAMGERTGGLRGLAFDGTDVLTMKWEDDVEVAAGVDYTGWVVWGPGRQTYPLWHFESEGVSRLAHWGQERTPFNILVKPQQFEMGGNASHGGITYVDMGHDGTYTIEQKPAAASAASTTLGQNGQNVRGFGPAYVEFMGTDDDPRIGWVDEQNISRIKLNQDYNTPEETLISQRFDYTIDYTRPILGIAEADEGTAYILFHTGRDSGQLGVVVGYKDFDGCLGQ